MENTKDNATVERSIVDRMLWSGERNITRLIVVLVLALVLLAGWAVTETVLRRVEHKQWLDFMSGYDFETYDYSQDGEGINIMGSGNEAVNYGPEVAGAPNDAEKGK